MKIKTMLGLMVLLLIVLFSLQNAGAVTIRFLFWHFTLSQALVILLTAVSSAFAGFVLGSLGSWTGKGPRS
jgi:lipopolysaccharide assembly protein A